MHQNASPGTNSKIVEYFNEVLSVENAAIDRLKTRIGECPVQEGKQRLQQHLEETRGATKQASGHNIKIWQQSHRRQSSPVHTKTAGDSTHEKGIGGYHKVCKWRCRQSPSGGIGADKGQGRRNTRSMQR